MSKPSRVFFDKHAPDVDDGDWEDDDDGTDDEQQHQEEEPPPLVDEQEDEEEEPPLPPQNSNNVNDHRRRPHIDVEADSGNATDDDDEDGSGADRGAVGLEQPLQRTPGDYRHLHYVPAAPIAPPDGSQPFDLYVLSASYDVHTDASDGRRHLEVQLMGSTSDGTTARVRVRGFRPHFVVRRPSRWTTARQVNQFVTALEEGLRAHLAGPACTWQLAKALKPPRSDDLPTERLVCGWRALRGRELIGYDGNELHDYIDIDVLHPLLVRQCRTMIAAPYGRAALVEMRDDREITEAAVGRWCPPSIAVDVAAMDIYEADVDFVMRFFVDTELVPSAWLRVAGDGAYRVVPRGEKNRAFVTHELVVPGGADALSMIRAGHPLHGTVPNQRVLSFDLECMPHNVTGFPMTSKGDPILQIGVATGRLHDGDRAVHDVVFTLDRTYPLTPKYRVVCCADQATLLREFQRFFRAYDPDWVMHHNGNGFDWNYLLETAERLGMRDYAYGFSRVPGQRVRTSSRLDRKKGVLKWAAVVPGRINMDLLRVMQTKFGAPEQLNLSSVSAAYLNGEVKEEFSYALIDQYQRTAEGRARMARYCHKDAALVWRVAVKCNELLTQLSMSSIARIPVQTVLDRAQGVKIEGRLRAECWKGHARGVPPRLKVTGKKRVFSTVRSESVTGKGYQGATVLPPKAGFYDVEQRVYPRRVAQLAAELDAMAVDDARDVGDADGRRAELTPPRYAEYEALADLEIVCNVRVPLRSPAARAEVEAVVRRALAVAGGDAARVAAMRARMTHAERLLIAAGAVDHLFTNTLDFCAMYPSIMIDMNLCFSTLVSEATIRRLNLVEGVDYERLRYNVERVDPLTKERFIEEVIDPTQPAFVTPARARGILPEIERELGRERAAVRAEMAALAAARKRMIEVDGVLATDARCVDMQFRVDVLNARQNAIKTWMNSMYGVTGFADSTFYQPEIAMTVTGRGRTMIERTRFEAERQFSRAAGWWFDTDVVYGDTDSVFCKIDGLYGDAALACALGAVQADTVTRIAFAVRHAVPGEEQATKLDFEKTISPLLMNTKKKKYAGQMFVAAERDAKRMVKGMDIVRRGPPPYHKKALTDIIDGLVMRREHVLSVAASLGAALRRLEAHEVNPALLVKCTQIKKPLEDYGAAKLVEDTSVAGKAAAACRRGQRKLSLPAAGATPATGGGADLTLKKAAMSAVIKLAKRMAAADPEHPPQPGDSLTYIMTGNLTSRNTKSGGKRGAAGGDARPKVSDQAALALDVLADMREGRPVNINYAYYAESLEVNGFKLLEQAMLRHAPGAELSLHTSDAVRAVVSRVSTSSSPNSNGDGVGASHPPKPRGDVPEVMAAQSAAKKKANARKGERSREKAVRARLVELVYGSAKRVVKQVTTRAAGGIASMLVARPQCVSCDALLIGGGGAIVRLCPHCATDASTLARSAAARHADLVKRECQVWDACRTCMAVGVDVRDGRCTTMECINAPLNARRTMARCARCAADEHHCPDEACANHSSVARDGVPAWQKCATCTQAERVETSSCINVTCVKLGERAQLTRDIGRTTAKLLALQAAVAALAL